MQGLNVVLGHGVAVGKHAAAQRLAPLRGRNELRLRRTRVDACPACLACPASPAGPILGIPDDVVPVHGGNADVFRGEGQGVEVELDVAGGFLEAEDERGAAADGIDRRSEDVHAVGDGAPAVGADGRGGAGVMGFPGFGAFVAEHELDAVPVVRGLRDALRADADRQHEAESVA